MALKELLQNKFYIITTAHCCLLVVMSSCNEPPPPLPEVSTHPADTVRITADTISANETNLTVNGVYFFNNRAYSGIIKTVYPSGNLHSLKSVYGGKMHGVYKSFYENGDSFEVRKYVNNLSTGRHYGYWPTTGKLKFDYNYYEEKREGPQKKWYKDGKPYLFANFKYDKEEGLQQGWRENGKLFINYVVKAGHTYGLQQSALCYTLINEKIKYQ